MEDLTSIPKLKDVSTFRMWRAELQIWFATNDMTALIDGSYTEAAALVISEAEQKRWRRIDAKAKRAMLLTMENELKEHVIHLPTSSAMWNKLVGMFQHDNAHMKDKLMQDFFEFRFDESKPIIENISKIQACAQRLNALEVTVNDSMIISKILNGLPMRYANFQTAWESTASAERTLERLLVRLQLEEQRKNGNQGKTQSPSVAFHVQGQNYGQTARCYLCHEIGHIKRNCPKSKSRFNGPGTSKSCDNCGRSHGGQCWRPQKAKPYQKNPSKKSYPTFSEACPVCGFFNHKANDCHVLKQMLKEKNASKDAGGSKESGAGTDNRKRKYQGHPNRTYKRNEGQGKVSFHASSETKNN